MNVLSVFSGIGGIDLGLERAGMTTVGQVELDPFCQAKWPGCRRLQQIVGTGGVPTPDDVRTDDGLPHRMDRLEKLGNAVVPALAEHIGRLIMSAA